MSTPARATTPDVAPVDQSATPAERIVPEPTAVVREPIARTEEAPAARTDEERAARTEEEAALPLFADSTCDALWQRWNGLQAGFVDQPRRAVEEADALVAETMRQLADTFAQERSTLEQQWGRGDDVSTEDLRIAFRRYRSFFKRLLSV